MRPKFTVYLQIQTFPKPNYQSSFWVENNLHIFLKKLLSSSFFKWLTIHIKCSWPSKIAMGWSDDYRRRGKEDS